MAVQSGCSRLRVALLHTDLGIQPLSLCDSVFPQHPRPDGGRRSWRRHTCFLKALAREWHMYHPLTFDQRALITSPHQQEEGRLEDNDKSTLCRDNQPSLPHLASFGSSFRCQVKGCSSRKPALSLQEWGLGVPPMFIQHP